MKSKTFIILLVIFCVLAGAVYFNFYQKEKKAGQSDEGEQLFGSLPVEEISSITINSNEGAATLKKDSNIWVVEKQFNYLADFSLITQLVTHLKTLKVGRSFEGSADSISRLGLHLPGNKDAVDEEKGLQIILKNGHGDVMVDILAGKTRELTAGAGGNYIMPTSGNTIYLVDKKLDELGKTDLDWIQKDLMDVKEEAIEKVVCYPLGEDRIIYTLKRPEKNKPPELVGVAPADALNPSKVDDILTALSPLTIDGVAGYSGDTVASGITYTHRFEYHLYNGEVYDFIPGRAKDENTKKYYLKAWLKNEGNSEVAGSTRNLIHKWVYQIPEWKFGRFIENPDDLISKTS